METNHNNNGDKMDTRPTFDEAVCSMISPLINVARGGVSTAYRTTSGKRMLTITDIFGRTIAFTWHGQEEGFSFAGEIE